MKYIVILFTSLIITFQSFASKNHGNNKQIAKPTGFIYGIGLGLNQEIYKNYDHRIIPLPVLGYRGEKLQVLGPFVSYKITSFDQLDFSLQIAPRFQGFDESDSDIFKNMAKRKLSIDAGFGVNYKINDWKIELSSTFDVLNRSNGHEIKTGVSKVYNIGPIFLEPSINLSFLDDNHVNYYYGVKANEVNQKTFMYTGKSAINPTFSLAVSTPIFLGGFTRFSLNYTYYDDSITNSPLVDNNESIGARLLFSKYF